MLIENNILKRIDPEDIIDGVFTAPDDVLYTEIELYCDDVLKMILPNVLVIGDGFLNSNRVLKHLEMPKVVKIGYGFLYRNDSIESLDIPNIKEIGLSFLYYNTKFKFNHNIIKALRGHMYCGGQIVDKTEYLRKLNIKKLLC